MIFKILIERDNKKLYWYLNNLNFSLYDENFKELNKNESNISNTVLKDYYEPPEDSDDSSVNLTITMGSKCNYKCKYCPELEFRGQIHDAHPRDISIFKTRLLKHFDLSRIKAIGVSGGEPLVYWKTLKEFITFFNENCPNLRNFRFITNGELLTDSIVDESKEKGIRVVVSDDGLNNSNRKFRTLEKAELDFKRYDRFAKKLGNDFVIRYQLGKHHLDAIEIYNYFKKKIPNIKCIADQGVIETVMPNSRSTEAMLFINDLTDDELKLLSDSRYELLLSKKPELQNTRRLLERYKTIVSSNFKITHLYNCKTAYWRDIFIDTLGNILKCQWVPTKENILGNISDKENIKFIGLIPWSERTECYKCPLVLMCKGVCPLASNESVETSCKLKFANELAFFKAAMKECYNVDVIGFFPLEGLPNSSTNIFNNYKSNYYKIKDKVKWEFK